jgi:hypothetical protein
MLGGAEITHEPADERVVAPVGGRGIFRREEVEQRMPRSFGTDRRDVDACRREPGASHRYEKPGGGSAPGAKVGDSAVDELLPRQLLVSRHRPIVRAAAGTTSNRRLGVPNARGENRVPRDYIGHGQHAERIDG